MWGLLGWRGGIRAGRGGLLLLCLRLGGGAVGFGEGCFTTNDMTLWERFVLGQM